MKSLLVTLTLLTAAAALGAPPTAAPDPTSVYQYLPDRPQAALDWITTYDATVAKQPNLLLLAGDLHRQQGDLNRALHYFDRGTQTFPSDVRFWTEVGTTKAMAGDLDGAKRAYLEAVATDSGDVNARLGLARIDFWNGDIDAAEASYESLLLDAPQRPDVYNDYVRFLIAQQRWTKAQAVKRMATSRGLVLQSDSDFEAAFENRTPFKVGATAGTQAGLDTAAFRFAVDAELKAEAGFFATAELSHDGFAAFAGQLPGQIVVPNAWRLEVGAGRRMMRGGGMRALVSGTTNFDSVAVARVAVEGWTPQVFGVTAFGALQLGTGTQVADALVRAGASVSLPADFDVSETVFLAADLTRVSGASLTTVAWRGLSPLHMSLSGIVGTDYVFETDALTPLRLGAVANVGTQFGNITLDAWVSLNSDVTMSLETSTASAVTRVTYAF